jgi:hypothetical protein
VRLSKEAKLLIDSDSDSSEDSDSSDDSEEEDVALLKYKDYACTTDAELMTFDSLVEMYREKERIEVEENKKLKLEMSMKARLDAPRRRLEARYPPGMLIFDFDEEICELRVVVGAVWVDQDADSDDDDNDDGSDNDNDNNDAAVDDSVVVDDGNLKKTTTFATDVASLVDVQSANQLLHNVNNSVQREDEPSSTSNQNYSEINNNNNDDDDDDDDNGNNDAGTLPAMEMKQKKKNKKKMGSWSLVTVIIDQNEPLAPWAKCVIEMNNNKHTNNNIKIRRKEEDGAAEATDVFQLLKVEFSEEIGWQLNGAFISDAMVESYLGDNEYELQDFDDMVAAASGIDWMSGFNDQQMHPTKVYQPSSSSSSISSKVSTTETTVSTAPTKRTTRKKSLLSCENLSSTISSSHDDEDITSSLQGVGSTWSTLVEKAKEKGKQHQYNRLVALYHLNHSPPPPPLNLLHSDHKRKKQKLCQDDSNILSKSSSRRSRSRCDTKKDEKGRDMDKRRKLMGKEDLNGGDSFIYDSYRREVRKLQHCLWFDPLKGLFTIREVQNQHQTTTTNNNNNKPGSHQQSIQSFQWGYDGGKGSVVKGGWVIQSELIQSFKNQTLVKFSKNILSKPGTDVTATSGSSSNSLPLHIPSQEEGRRPKRAAAQTASENISLQMKHLSSSLPSLQVTNSRPISHKATCPKEEEEEDADAVVVYPASSTVDRQSVDIMIRNYSRTRKISNKQK